MKLLFFFPNTSNSPVIPMGLGRLMHIARKEGVPYKYFETTFYERGRVESFYEVAKEFKPFDRKRYIKFLPFDELVPDLQKLIDEYDPDFMLVTAISAEFELFVRIIGQIELKDHCKVIVGGTHPTLAPEEAINHPRVDAICLGEGEVAFEHFLQRLKGGQDFLDTPNFWFKIKGNIIRNPRASMLSAEKLWRSSYRIDYDSFDRSYFTKPFDGKVYYCGVIELSRGCPYCCTYCAESALRQEANQLGLGPYVRLRAIDAAIQEMQELKEKFALNFFQLQDESFLSMSKRRLVEFAEKYGKLIGAPLILQTRPEAVTREKVIILRSMELPVLQVSIGVESGNEYIRRVVCRRNCTNQQIIDAFDICHEFGIRTCGFFMMGFPYETEERIMDTFRLARRIQSDVAIMNFMFPFPGQPIRDICIKEGYIRGDERCVDLPEESILNLPGLSKQRLRSMRLCFPLYRRLPEPYLPDVLKCMEDIDKHVDLYDHLVEVYEQYRDVRLTQ